MATVVVPFRGLDPKRRLEPLPTRERTLLAAAMLADVAAAAAAVGEVVVVAPAPPSLERPIRHVADPGGGQGAAVAAALATAVEGPFLVVNADLPCATADELLALAAAVPPDGIALVAAADGTTNALALARADLFAPLYGPGSARRFAALAPSRRLELPGLAADVDVLADLARLAGRLGPHTRRALAALRSEAA